MRIATVCGVLLWLAGCNDLPLDEGLGGDDQSLKANADERDDAPLPGTVPGSAGKGANDVPNASAEASPNDDLACQLKVKECYAQGNDQALCDAISKGCQPPAPSSPPCGEDCDASVRACFAKGIDAKTCDALYHECSAQGPGSGTVPANDPNVACMINAKECYAQNGDPAKCDALLESCSPPKPGPDPALDCELKYKSCIEAGVDAATCDTLAADCRKNTSG